MLVQFDLVGGGRVSVQLFNGVRVLVLVQFHQMFGIDAPVQLVNRVLMLVDQFLTRSMDMVM